MKHLWVGFALFALIPSVWAQTPTMEYTVQIKDPVSHLYDVEVAISGVRETRVEVAMPAWSPGAYSIRDFARNVQQFEVVTSQNRPLSWEQTDKQTWRIAKAATDDLRVRYRVYSTALTDEMADITPAALFMYVVGRTQSPVRVKYDLRNGWKVYTGLDKRGDLYHAPSYDVLASSPAFLGEFKIIEFKSSAGASYRVVFTNRRKQLSDLQVEADLKDLANAADEMVGPPPYRDYVFLVKVQPTPGSASVGYFSSTRMVVGENDFVSQNSYTNFLSSAAQGLMKAWNGNLIRPQSMEPYDFSKEAYSRLLWFTEGGSAYLADLLMLRARILSADEYFLRVSPEFDALQHQPGRTIMSLEDASWNAWTRSDNSANAGISYPLKGKIAALLLDTEIRGRTLGQKGLVDVLRLLAKEYGESPAGIADDKLLAAIQTATGLDCSDFFNRVVRSTREIEYGRYLEKLGLLANRTNGADTLTFGIEFERNETSQVRVRRVLPGSAAEAAQLDAGDIIVAMDSERVTYENLVGRIHSKGPGKSIELAVIRGERLLSIDLTPLTTRSETWSLEPSLRATPEQIRIRNLWLGIPPGNLRPLP